MLRAFDYECPKGHKFEVFYKATEPMKEFVPCLGKDKSGKMERSCSESAQWVPSFFYNSEHSARAQRFSPVVIHKDAQGNIRYPAHANAPVPEGFQKVELTTVQQVRSLEREVNSRDREQSEKFRHSRQIMLDGQLKENRRVMEGLVQKFTPRGRKFYEKMREVSERRRLRGPNDVKPEFVVEAFSQNQSNREAYYNEYSQHGSHRGGR